MDYISTVIEAIRKKGHYTAGYRGMLVCDDLYLECREHREKDSLRVFQLGGGYQRYWPSVPSNHKQAIYKECQELLREDCV